MLALTCSRSDASRAGVVSAMLPGEDPALLKSLATELSKAGYTLTGVSVDTLIDSARLESLDLDLLVLPNAADLPAKSVQAIGDFARGGGDIIALNAPLWQRMLVNADGKWTTQEEYQHANAGNLPKHVLFDFSDTSGWQRTANTMDSPTTFETTADDPVPGQRAVHGLITNLTGWDNYGIRNLDKPFPQGHKLTVFSAKGDENTRQLAIEWVENDGSRWLAVVALSSEWRQYVLKPGDFVYWTSVEGRGGRGDTFKPENAVSFSFGLAFSHTGWEEGRHEFWVGPVGTAESMPDLGSVLGPFDLPAMDTLCPSYKLFDAHGVSSLSVRQDQVMVSTASPALTGNVRSPQPRPNGAGFDKRRDWRWIPIVEARSADKQWRGTPVTMMVNAAGQYKGGVWASFGFDGSAIYKQPKTLAMVRQIAERMRNGAFILDGGANFYTYFDNQDVQLGMRICNVGKEARQLTARVVVVADQTRKPPALKQWKLSLQPGETKTVSDRWRPKQWPADGYTVLAELLQNGKVIDSVTHKINVWRPKKIKHYITNKDGQFMLNGKLWRAHGVNYMPSSGIGIEDGEYFEHWISARAYDPEVIDRDLDHIKAMGLNSVSIFIYTGVEKDQNLLDILRRLEARGMKANVGLRPGMPEWWNWDKIRQIIERMRLPESDTVFAYDIAWEPMFNTHNDRKIYDGDWEKWIIERYFSVEAAEEKWGFAVPRNPDGTITNPLPEQVDNDGPWLKMTAAYRRFLDTLLYKQYSVPRREIRSIDPHHMVSFRMAEAANPTYRWDGRIPYDFPYLAAAVDILEPEAYGRIGDWERVKPGWFAYAYAKWAAPTKPMIWAEMGVHAWDLSRMQDSQQKLDFQAMYHKAFYRMMISSGANGIFFWWYPGGFRYGENSDYGIINPDGTDKPVTKVIRENARKFLDAPAPKKPDYWIEIDRDIHPVGIAGIYDEAKDKFWAAIDKGQIPGLKTAGTGTDSSNTPLRYLDAAFDSVQLLGADGKSIDVAKDGRVKAAALWTPVYAWVKFTNLGEAKLLKPSMNAAVQLVLDVAGKRSDRQPITEDIPHLGSGAIAHWELMSTRPTESTKVTITFSNGSTDFGERFSFTLEP